MTIIDAHCHIGQGCAYSLSVDDLLREMDRNQVTSAIVVPTDRQIAVFNQEGNDLVLSATRAHPGRLIPFATVNPWYGDKALDELRRAFDAGAVGLKLHPVLQGFTITDEIVFPVLELAIERDKPVYFHTGTPVSCTPFHLTEVAMRYPSGTFVMGHAAFSDYWNDVVASVQCVPNVYIETSQHLASFLRVLVEQVGSDRLIYGSDSPKAAMPVEIEKITHLIHDPEDLDNIFSRNIKRLLRCE